MRSLRAARALAHPTGFACAAIMRNGDPHAEHLVPDKVDPLATPREVLEAFVASCKVGACNCDTMFVSHIVGVDLFEEPGHLRVEIIGEITPEEVLAEVVASALALSSPS